MVQHVWGSTDWGATCTRSEKWQATVTEAELRLNVGGQCFRHRFSDFKGLTLRPGIVWATFTFDLSPGPIVTVGGIPNSQARELKAEFEGAHAAFRRREEVRRYLREFNEYLPAVVAWYLQVDGEICERLSGKQWLTEECLQRWARLKPVAELHLDDSVIAMHVSRSEGTPKSAIRLWTSDLRTHVAALNQELTDSELIECKSFFDKVEKTPLTVEQAKAVLCFDNRVLVVASAGSGKTSTMVAKAGYALHRQLVPASKILLLAFNRDAAAELQIRIRDRLTPLNLPAEKIVARTFHAFGLDVIGAATGRRPTLAPWLEHGGDVAYLMTLVDELKGSNPTFCSNWDLFRIVLGKDLPEFGKESESTEDWDEATRVDGFRTLKGEIVKSRGERVLADWLFYNGVNYQYEPAYQFDTADATHRQYRPDFYYPDIDCYHEHWALDEHGQPPAAFVGYLDGVEWKRRLHADRGTNLIETTMAELWSGRAFRKLAMELSARGIELDPNPDREVAPFTVVHNDQLVRTFRTFLTHAKSNRLNDEALRERLRAGTAGPFRHRHELFLTLFDDIRDGWEQSLRNEHVIDFEDMLNVAADCVEAGSYESPYELIMVDEFQDASQARARLARALVRKAGRCLFAVGDDWQSINRFAGADMSVMTKFEEWFGKGHTLRLERTFRCPQSLCDVSSRFVQRNPFQIAKAVVSAAPEIGPVIGAIEVEDENRIQTTLTQQLENLRAGILSGEIPRGARGNISVFVLGRYRKDRAHVPPVAPFSDCLSIEFHTVHGSKGLEADYVFLPRLTSGWMGFPSSISDDPVLRLAMPSGDEFDNAEERRLFYVALTRARRGVVVVTLKRQHSSFLTELLREHGITAASLAGEPVVAIPCPRSGCTGTLVVKNGRYGKFLGCTAYGACRETRRLPTD